MAEAKGTVSIGMEFPAIKQPNNFTKYKCTWSIVLRTLPGKALARLIRSPAAILARDVKNLDSASQARSYGCVRSLLHRSHNSALDLNTSTLIPLTGRFLRFVVLK